MTGSLPAVTETLARGEALPAASKASTLKSWVLPGSTCFSTKPLVVLNPTSLPPS